MQRFVDTKNKAAKGLSIWFHSHFQGFSIFRFSTGNEYRKQEFIELTIFATENENKTWKQKPNRS